VIAQVGASVSDITSLGGLLPGNPIAQAANNVLRQGAALTQLAPLYQMQSVLERMQKNVLAGPLANGTSSMTTSNTTLQRVAADSYGDQSRWTEIAAANNIQDPMLGEIQTIKIPIGE
jgi:nucleoid-associated protein YgaU